MCVNPTYNVHATGCPSQKVLALVADKWSALVMHSIGGRTVRYLQLQREIGGISQKMLTQTLQNLERHGFVARRVYAVVPPKVEYSLTELGQDLMPRLCALVRWCEENANAVESSVLAYDQKKVGAADGS